MTVKLIAVPLWIIDPSDGKLSHAEGYPLAPVGMGSAKRWLSHNQSHIWQDTPTIHYHGDLAFDSAEAATEFLTEWTKQVRERLSEAYRSLTLLATEQATAEAIKQQQIRNALVHGGG